METEINNESSMAPPGTRLKTAREAAGLTLDQAAEHLKITVNYIRALEEDNHESLPDRPYVLGYLRAYSRLLSLDTEALLQDYQVYFNGVDDVADAKAVSGDAYASGFSLGTWVLIIVAVLLLWGGAVTFFGDGDATAETSQEAAEVSLATPVDEPETTAIIQDVESEALSTDAVDVIDDGSETAQDSTVGSETEAVDSTQTTGSVDPSPLDQGVPDSADAVAGVAASEVAQTVTELTTDKLEFAFSGECWLEVTDANGDVLVADLFQTGDDFKTEGKAPFDVMMGNVRMVNLLFNGEAYDLKPNGFRSTLRTQVQ